MVKAWKEEQAAHIAPLLQMPDIVTNSMHKAALDIWAAASTLRGNLSNVSRRKQGKL
jgi:hypothetical protein